MSNKNPNGNAYEIGYKRPPQSTRFKPGRSGNPKGRQKGSRNFASVLEAELNTRISVTENGIRKTISKREATAKHLVNKAASGNLPAAKLLLEQERQHENEQLPLQNVPRELLPPDHLVLKSLQQRLLQRESQPETGETDEARSSQQQMGNTGDAADDSRSSQHQTANSSNAAADDAQCQASNSRISQSSVGSPRNHALLHAQERFPLDCDPLYPPCQESGHESD